MRAARLRVLACPSCGGSVAGACSSVFIDCPSCGSPLAVLSPDATPRYAVPPLLASDPALAAARRSWEGTPIPGSFLIAARIEPPRLAFVAYYEIERTLMREGDARRVLVETLDRVPAVDLPGSGVESLDLQVLSDPDRRVPFDPKAQQRQGLVFDPSRPAREAAPIDPAIKLLEERVSVVYLPVWFVRCRHGRNLYEVTVDGSTGGVLRGRAPAERDARLPQAIAGLYVLAFAGAFLLRKGPATAFWLLRLQEAGLVGGLFLLAGLAWVLAWSWDRVRFRYEVVIEGEKRELRALNRPERTAPERVRDALFGAASKLFERRGARRGWE